jgi:hypothetical protein
MEPRTPQHVLRNNSENAVFHCPHPPQRYRVEEIPDERCFPLFPLPLEHDDERIIVHSLQRVSLQPRKTAPTNWRVDARSPERRSTRQDHLSVRECPKIPLSVDPDFCLQAPSRYLSMKPTREFM